MLLVNSFVSCHGFTIKKLVVNIIICHEDMTGKRGENVAGMGIHPFSMEFLCFGRKILHCSIFDDVITLHY